MSSFFEKVIARVDDDSGADMFKRYFAQIEYTAFWCARMLWTAEGIEAVVPEGYEDVLIIRKDGYEQRQIKTRSESVGPWTVADVIPIFTKQYVRAARLDRPSTFHFCSNGCADTATTFRGQGLGSLYRLRSLLDALRLETGLTTQETEELNEFFKRICPKIKAELQPSHPNLTQQELEGFLKQTYIETDSELVHYPNHTTQYSQRNVAECSDALLQTSPGQGPFMLFELVKMYERLILLIEGRIRLGTTLANRKIGADDVLKCRVVPIPSGLTIDWDTMPGETLMEKKARYAGFDSTRIQNMYRQHTSAQSFRRQLRSQELEKLDALAVAMLDRQISCREELSSSQPTTTPFGPEVLSRFRASIGELVREYFPSRNDITDQICLGLVWDETNQCHALWHCNKAVS